MARYSHAYIFKCCKNHLISDSIVIRLNTYKHIYEFFVEQTMPVWVFNDIIIAKC